MEYEARYNIMVKWFIGLNLDLGEDKWKDLFFSLLRQIENAGHIKDKDYVDETHVIANIAIPGTIDLLRQGIKDAMKAIQDIDPDLYEELGGEKTVKPKGKIFRVMTLRRKIRGE